MLEVDGIDTFYGQSHILHDVSLDVLENEVVALLGRNGVGKTTTLRSIIGLTPPRRGRITFAGEEITGLRADRIAMRGIGYVPQGRRMFPDLTVRENLEMGFGRSAIDDDRIEELYELFPRLADREGQRAITLSGGEQQMVAVARALVREPDLLLLDEPTEGLMPTLVDEFGDVIGDITAAGYAILLVEQNVDFSLAAADRAYLMDNGRIRHEASTDELREADDVLGRHLGVGGSGMGG